MFSNIQPKFGAILVKELSFKQGHSQENSTVATFEVTGEDRAEFDSLTGIGRGDTVRIGYEADPGLEKRFRVNNTSFNPTTVWVMVEDSDAMRPKTTYVDKGFYQLTRRFIEKAPLTADVKQHLISSMEKASRRQGENGKINRTK